MKLSKITAQHIALFIAGVMFVGAIGFSFHSSQSKKDDNETVVASTEYVDTEETSQSSLTAGVTMAMRDYINLDIQTVDKTIVTSAEDDGTICGYTNLGVATISEGNLNIRKSASISGKVVGKMTNHNACEILGVDGEWYYIQSGSVTGYVKSDYVVTGETAMEIAELEKKDVAKVNTETLRVREMATVESDIISLVGNGEILTVVSTQDDWVQVEVDDMTGFVSQEYVELGETLPTAVSIKELEYGVGISDTRVNLVAYACQFVGNPYVWGGESLTKGIDCSGFTMKVYQKFGIYLPHYSGSQPSYGTKIDASKAQPGDLFFYGSGSKINHVAIYIGNGQIVHASNKKDGIKISNAYYRKPICVVSYLK